MDQRDCSRVQIFFSVIIISGSRGEHKSDFGSFKQGGFSISRHSVKENANMIFDRAAVSITNHPSVTFTEAVVLAKATDTNKDGRPGTISIHYLRLLAWVPWWRPI